MEKLDYKHPETGEELTYDTLVAMSDEMAFKAFFPVLTPDNWKKTIKSSNWDWKDMPYSLMVENNSGYSQDCHFCGNYQGHNSCPIPFTDEMNVLDMLHKVGVEDNTSFYQNKNGKSDFIVNLVWHTNLKKEF